MNDSFCIDVQIWLGSLDSAAVPTTPPQQLANHVSGCPRCRAALLLLAIELLHVTLEITQMACDQCQNDLAAYIDLDHDSGSAEAIHAYPHVWWHLWTCADCVKMYEMITTLQDAEAKGTLSRMPLTSFINCLDLHQTRPVIKAITLPRMWFTRILVPQFGPTWGQNDGDTVIHENAEDNYQINATVCKADGQWMVVITINPPLDGDVVLTLGTVAFRSRLGPNGVANIWPIPANLLTSPDGPDMAIMIEPVTP